MPTAAAGTWHFGHDLLDQRLDLGHGGVVEFACWFRQRYTIDRVRIVSGHVDHPRWADVYAVEEVMERPGTRDVAHDAEVRRQRSDLAAGQIDQGQPISSRFDNQQPAIACQSQSLWPLQPLRNELWRIKRDAIGCDLKNLSGKKVTYVQIAGFARKPERIVKAAG